MSQDIKNRLVKIAFRLIALLIGCFLLLVVGIQLPFVQTVIVKKAGAWLSKTSGYQVQLSSATIQWFDQVNITGLQVVDDAGNTMIDINSITVDLELNQLLSDDGNNIDAVEIEGAKIFFTYLAESDSSSIINISRFINNINKNLNKKSTKAPLPFSIDEIELENVQFTMSNPAKDSIAEGFDYNHFTVNELQTYVKNFTILRDSVGFQITHLSGIDQQSGLHLKSLKSKFHLTAKSMEFNLLHLITNKSEVRDFVRFEFNNWADWSDFNNNIKIIADLKHTDIHTKDLSYFVPKLRKYNQNFVVSGNYKGKVRSFNGNNFDLRFGGNKLTGRISMFGLPNMDETFMDFKLNNSVVDFSKLKPVFKPRTYEILKPFGETLFSGSFSGFLNDFVAFGNFNTRFGAIYSDVNLKVNDNVALTEYSGNLKMTQFDIGKYTKRDSLFQLITMNGKIEGKGITLETAEFELEGKISEIGIKQYVYKNIQTDAKFSSELFNGRVSIDDPNLQFSGSGSIDLRNNLNKVNIVANLDTANLVKLKLSENIHFLHSNLSLDGYGLKLNNIRGRANLFNSIIKYDSNTLQTDTLKIVSKYDSSSRELDIQSEFFDARVEGNFKTSEVFKDFKSMVKEYLLNINNDSEALKKYYSNKTINQNSNNKYSLKYNIDLQHMDPLMELINKDVFIEPNTNIEGTFTKGESIVFNLFSSIGEMNYKGTSLFNTDIELMASKLADSTKVLATGFLMSEKQVLPGGFETKNFFSEIIWDNTHIDFQMEGEQANRDHFAKLKGYLDFKPDEIQIHLLPSEAQFIHTNWKFNDSNLLILKPHYIEADSIELYSNDNQRIFLNGVISENPSNIFKVVVQNLELENLSPLTRQKITGKMNTELKIKNLFDIPSVESKLDIKTLVLDDFLIGNIAGTSHWNKSTKKFDIRMNVEKDAIKNITVEGSYNPEKNKSPLDLNVNFEDADLKIIEPFFKFMFSSLEGKTNGRFNISGTPLKPEITGSGNIEHGQAKINYLNTMYDLDGRYSFGYNKISFQNLTITDVNGGKGALYGDITHKFFQDFTIDIQGDFKELMVLNTTLRDNDLFYGTGVATGDVSFSGPSNQLSIKANGATDKGSRIHIPIGGLGNITQEEYISFVSLKDTLNKVIEKQIEEKKVAGLDIDLNLELNKNAYCEIIFDIQAGDIIRGTGEGRLNLKLSPEGDFNMFGDYTILQGGYNFTLYNIINKEFEIAPNSTIKWFGDPYGAELNINAAYKQLASLSPLVDTTFHKAPEIKRSYPTEVNLILKGEMLSPEIDFDIKVAEYPKSAVTVDGNVLYFEEIVGQLYNNIHSDDQELNRQVFSLIILRKFSAPESFNTAGSIGNSVSEFVSNQLSYWASQVDDNLEIDVNLGDLSQEAYNTFQLRLSYAFMEGRLRITREGGFDNENPDNVANIVGDWTVEYALSADGRLKAKMFSRNNYNSLNINKQTTYTTGFSLSHTQSFDEVRELFSRSRKKKKKQEQQNKIKINEEGVIRQDEVQK